MFSNYIFAERHSIIWDLSFFDIEWSDDAYWRLMWLLKTNVGYEWNLYIAQPFRIYIIKWSTLENRIEKRTKLF